ncbi:serine hydrolase domain-containing protein [Aquihabitans daechungensis]|uniref:serine hydrolase domain-containing protein n=1 Tax=Aquihabitans daechungensis TaxID=1052257 RepID=UPI003BA2D50D
MTADDEDDDMDTTELAAAMDATVAAGDASSIVWLVAIGDEVQAGAVGHLDADPGRPTRRDTIFRISSMTKPVTAVAALQLVDDGVLGLDDPVDDLLPELADRQVLVDPHGSLDDTVAAERSITLRDLLTFRMGLGFDFAMTGPQPSLDRLAELGLPPGPPRPQEVPPPAEWLATIGSVPLEFQPGTRWLYHLSADVLGVLIERASGRTLGEQFAQRIFEPLAMADTGFSVPASKADRFGACFGEIGDDGTLEVFDPADGQWATEPAFRAGGAGLVSTVDDFHAFAAMLQRGGTHDGERLLSPGLLAAMTTNQLTGEQIATGGPAPGGDAGWGFGVGIQLRTVPIRGAGAYDWDGGLGSSWANDPDLRLTGVLLTDRMWTAPVPPQVCDDFWRAAYRVGRG